MEIKLYYTPHTRSLRPRWLLEELGLRYQLIPIDLFAGEAESEHYRQINPLAAVPAVEIDGEVMLESGAICHWLADRFINKKLAPALDSAERRRYEQWMFFVPGTLEPPAFYALLHSKILPEENRVTAIVPWTMQRYDSVIKVVNDALEGNNYLMGDQYTAADILVGSVLMWLPDALQAYPALQTYSEKLKQRLAYQRAIA